MFVRTGRVKRTQDGEGAVQEKAKLYQRSAGKRGGSLCCEAEQELALDLAQCMSWQAKTILLRLRQQQTVKSRHNFEPAEQFVLAKRALLGMPAQGVLCCLSCWNPCFLSAISRTRPSQSEAITKRADYDVDLRMV